MEAIKHALSQAARGTGATVFTVLGVVVLAFGVPLFWIWIASTMYGEQGAVTGPVAILIGTGILVSYFLALLIASWVRGRLAARWEEPRPRRQSWNRSMRDSPYRPGSERGDPIERIFVATAIVSMIAFVLWFALFAGAPFPDNPG